MAQHFDGSGYERRPEAVVVEEPLTIRLNEIDVATTMRTPGNDFELAVGLLRADGLLGPAQIVDIRYCATGSATDTRFNVVSVLAPEALEPKPRLGVISSSCGLCGSEAIEDLVYRLEPVQASGPIDTEVLVAIIESVAAQQPTFAATGASHAAAAFTADAEILLVREDIGRHNAVDKVVGRMHLDSMLPASGLALFVSGRASFEMVQKAWSGGFATVLSVSAPSALAVQAARAANLNLVGFARGSTLNVYA